MDIPELVEFTVVGGGYDPMANPMPKIKYTKRQQWLDRVQNFVMWKEHVVESYIAALEEAGQKEYADDAEQRVMKGSKPIATGTTPMRMDIHIYFRGKAHADPENVFGSIADALLEQDKWLAGSFEYTHLDKKEQPYVKITIQKYENTTG